MVHHKETVGGLFHFYFQERIAVFVLFQLGGNVEIVVMYFAHCYIIKVGTEVLIVHKECAIIRVRRVFVTECRCPAIP